MKLYVLSNITLHRVGAVGSSLPAAQPVYALVLYLEFRGVDWGTGNSVRHAGGLFQIRGE
jgi:hypothetical protein